MECGIAFAVGVDYNTRGHDDFLLLKDVATFPSALWVGTVYILFGFSKSTAGSFWS